jgi:hypothetical protein
LLGVALAAQEAALRGLATIAGPLQALASMLSPLGALASIWPTLEIVLYGRRARAEFWIPATLVGLADNDGYIVPAAGGGTKRVEYQVTGEYVATPGAATVDVRAAVAADDPWLLQVALGNVLATEIDGQQVGIPTVYLRNLYGVAGNVAVVQTFALGDWTVTGFVDGLDPLPPLGTVAARLLAMLPAQWDALRAMLGQVPDLRAGGDILGGKGGLSVQVDDSDVGSGGNVNLAAGDGADLGAGHPLIGGDIQLIPGVGKQGGRDGGVRVAGAFFTVEDWAALRALLTNPPVATAVARQTVYVTGTAATHNFLAGIKAARVRMVGGGGGGGSAVGNNNVAAAGGGSGGGYSETLLMASLGLPLTYTVGAGGAGGPADGAHNGADGEASTIALNGVTKTAYGGRGGITMPDGTAVLTGGQVGNVGVSTGDVATQGTYGQGGIRLSSTVGRSGSGGDSAFGCGGRGQIASTAGYDGGAHGGGGSGGMAVGIAFGVKGGDGTGGIIVIEEFY